MSNNSLTPIMTRLRMTSLRESGGEEGGETNTPTMMVNKNSTKKSSLQFFSGFCFTNTGSERLHGETE